jgi:beta-glucosidase
LTVSFPRSVGQLPLSYDALSTGKPIDHVDLSAPLTPETKYRSRYLDEDNAPLYPFGHGLSYTKFTYGKPRASQAALRAKALNSGGPGITVRTTVTNAGARDGVEVVQLYVRLRGTSVAQPMRRLAGFQRVALRAGEAREVELPVGREQLAIWSLDMKHVVEPAMLSIWVAPDATRGEPIEVTITE